MESTERTLIHSTFHIHKRKRTRGVQNSPARHIIMSFYRITNPKKRDAMVADYIATVKRIKERNLNERLGELAHQSELDETINPIVKANEKTSTAITNELKPLKKEIQDLNKHLRGRDLIVRGRKRHYEEVDDDGNDEYGVGGRRDKYFGIHGYPDEGGYRLGDKSIIVDEGRNIHIENVIYKSTPGLWKLIFSVNPKEYTENDWEQYKKLVRQTDLINNPSGLQRNSRPRLTKKYQLIKKALAEEEDGREVEEATKENERDEADETDMVDDGSKEEEEHVKEGSGVSFLPSTIKGLFDKLKLLTAEFIAGNTTTRNELIAVLDRLRKRGRITEKEYTTINTILAPK